MLASLNRFMEGKVSDTEQAQSFDDMCVKQGITRYFRSCRYCCCYRCCCCC